MLEDVRFCGRQGWSLALLRACMGSRWGEGELTLSCHRTTWEGLAVAHCCLLEAEPHMVSQISATTPSSLCPRLWSCWAALICWTSWNMWVCEC